MNTQEINYHNISVYRYNLKPLLFKAPRCWFTCCYLMVALIVVKEIGKVEETKALTNTGKH